MFGDDYAQLDSDIGREWTAGYSFPPLSYLGHGTRSIKQG
jgi:hypothetical protein